MKKYRIILAVLLSLVMLGASGCGVLGMMAQSTEETDSPLSTWKPDIQPAFVDPGTSTTDPEPSGEPEGFAMKKAYKTFGMFVRYGDRVFFHVPEEGTLSEGTTVSGHYLAEDLGTDNVLMCYDLVTCEPIMYFRDKSIGPMALSYGTLYYTINDGTKDMPKYTVMGYGLETDEIVSLNYEYVIGTDTTGEFMALWRPIQPDYSEIGIGIFDDGELLTEITASDYSRFIGMTDRYCVWQSADYENDVYKLHCADFYSGETCVLGTIPVEDRFFEEGAALDVDQKLIEDDKVYVCFGLYEGTGNFYTSSVYVEATLGVSDSLKLIPNENIKAVNGIEMEASVPFKVTNGVMEGTEGIPETPGVDEDGALGYYDEEGIFVGIIDGYANQYFNDGRATRNEYIEIVGDDIFVIKNGEKRSPGDDIGWREAYRRTSTTVDRIGMVSYEKDNVLTINGNTSLTDGEDILLKLADRPFLFSSGVGAWGTNLYIHEDGTFEGTFSDADMGVADVDYPNGTVYLCNFTGSFGPITQVDDYTFKTTVKTLDYNNVSETGTDNFIMDGALYIYTSPYGLNLGDEIEIYLPGKPIEELDEEFMSWIWYYVEDTDTELEEIGLNNTSCGYGFYTDSYADSVHEPIEEH